MDMTKKTIIVVASIIIAIVGCAFLGNYCLNKFSITDKERRIENRLLYLGTAEMDDNDIANEIELVLRKHTNWDNLFLSEHFKDKFKTRKNILDNVNSAGDIWCGAVHENGVNNTVVVLANHKKSIFDRDESDDISSMYRFQYVLNDAGEIDDLILIEKTEVYTIDGQPVE